MNLKQFISESIYLRFILSSIQSKMEYRGTFFAFLFTILGFYISQITVITLMVYKFKSINHWGAGELSLLYTLLIFSMGFTSIIFSGLIDFNEFIRKGDYDRILLRPLSSLGQILSMNFDLTGFMHLGLGFIGLYVTNQLLEIHWNMKNCLFFIATIIGGVLILGSIRIMIASICFYAVSNESLQHLIVFSSREFLLYPTSIYSKAIQFFLTFIFPIAFINYYPAQFFISKDPHMIFHPVLVYLTLPVGIILFILSLILWKLGEFHYGSTGS